MTEADLIITGVLGAAVLLLLGLFHKELVFLAFDEEMAQVVGLPVTFLYYLLLSIMALTVVIVIKVVGIVLVSALLVLPGATSLQLTKNIVPMVALSVVCGLIATLSGLYLSYTLDLASGATIVLTATALFGLAMAASLLRCQRVVPHATCVGSRHRRGTRRRARDSQSVWTGHSDCTERGGGAGHRSRPGIECLHSRPPTRRSQMMVGSRRRPPTGPIDLKVTHVDHRSARWYLGVHHGVPNSWCPSLLC